MALISEGKKFLFVQRSLLILLFHEDLCYVEKGGTAGGEMRRKGRRKECGITSVKEEVEKKGKKSDM